MHDLQLLIILEKPMIVIILDNQGKRLDMPARIPSTCDLHFLKLVINTSTVHIQVRIEEVSLAQKYAQEIKQRI